MPVELAESQAQPISGHGSGASGVIRVYHLIITALLSFALGGVVSVGMFLYCQRWRRAKAQAQDKMYSTLTKHQVHNENFTCFNTYVIHNHTY